MEDCFDEVIAKLESIGGYTSISTLLLAANQYANRDDYEKAEPFFVAADKALQTFVGPLEENISDIYKKLKAHFEEENND